jgi:hypothetical protein
MKSTMTAVGLLGFAALVSTSSQRLISAEPSAKSTLQQARTEARAQHFAEAAAAYEKVTADSSKDAAKYKADALYEVLLLRVSANPAVHDLQRGTAALEGLKAYPTYSRAPEIAAISALLEELNRQTAEQKEQQEQKAAADKELASTRTTLTTLTAKTNAIEAQLEAAKQADADETGKLKQDAVGLRAENKTLRDEVRVLREQLTKAQVEIQKRDEALKRVAGSLIKSR